MPIGIGDPTPNTSGPQNGPRSSWVDTALMPARGQRHKANPTLRQRIDADLHQRQQGGTAARQHIKATLAPFRPHQPTKAPPNVGEAAPHATLNPSSFGLGVLMEDICSRLFAAAANGM